MPARDEGASRRERRRRELLRALLEDEEWDEPAQSAENELAALLRDLRRGRRERPGLPSEKLQGFLWGVGAAALLLMVLPSAKRSLRPFAVSAIKGAFDLVDQLKSVIAEAGEGLQDLVAEAQFERMKEAAGPEAPSGAGDGHP